MADLLQVAEGTVKSQSNRGIAALRTAMSRDARQRET